MKFKNILFDLDGTLTDPMEGLAKAVIYSLEKMGIKENDKESIRRFIGPPLVCSYMDFYNMTKEQAELAVFYYRELYSDKGLYENRVYDGIEELLAALKDNDVNLYVATSKPQHFADKVISHFGLDKYFAFIQGVDTKNAEVSKTVIMEAIINKFNLDKADTAMVGDRKFDIDSANRVGITSIGILHGYGDVTEFESSGADIIVKDAYELKKYLFL